MFLLEDKVAFITGGLGGIGLGLGTTFLENGFRGVALADLDVSKSQEVIERVTKKFGGGKILILSVDVRSEEEVKKALDETVDFFGQLDLVVNCAGIVAEEDCQKSVDVNFVSVFHITKLALEEYLPKFKSSQEGVILNLASVLGLEPYPAAPVYSGTKSAVISLGLSFGSGNYYDEYKVKVLTICPGVTQTPILNFSYPENVPGLEEIIAGFMSLPSQTVEELCEKILPVLRNGKSGTVWVVEGGKEAYELVYGKRKI